MAGWLELSLLAVLLYGIAGVFQKMTTNRVSTSVSVVCCTVGYLILLPYLWVASGSFTAKPLYVIIGLLAGVTSQLGTWFLFAALEGGAKASVAVPFTALYPLLTIILAKAFLSERISPPQWVAVVLAFTAGMLMSYEKPVVPEAKAAPGGREVCSR